MYCYFHAFRIPLLTCLLFVMFRLFFYVCMCKGIVCSTMVSIVSLPVLWSVHTCSTCCQMTNLLLCCDFARYMLRGSMREVQLLLNSASCWRPVSGLRDARQRCGSPSVPNVFHTQADRFRSLVAVRSVFGQQTSRFEKPRVDTQVLDIV